MSFLNELESFLNEKWSDANKENIIILLDQIKNHVEISCKNEASVERLFNFAKENSLVKMVQADIPAGILPSNYKGSLFDVRIAGYGPDDKMYNKHKDIRENIPRGMTFLEMNNSSDLVIYANKKFTGGVGDEDDQQPDNDDVWKEFFLQPIEKTERIVAMTKLNGEAGHFSGRFIDGKFYIITGSKNVHMLVGSIEDIELYTETRYLVARQVATAVWKSLQSLDKKVLSIFQKFLCETKFTCVCEIQQPETQHIVDLSYLGEAELGLLMVTPTVVSINASSFTALAPDFGIDMFKAMGFVVPHIDIFPLTALDLNIKKIRSGYLSEGCVLYFLNANNETIGLSKVKTVWYILLRALREKAAYGFLSGKNRTAMTAEDSICSKTKRFKQIQRWIKFDDGYLVKWQKITDEYLNWLEKKISTGIISPKSIRPQFPVIWNNFLEETNFEDNIAISER